MSHASHLRSLMLSTAARVADDIERVTGPIDVSRQRDDSDEAYREEPRRMVVMVADDNDPWVNLVGRWLTAWGCAWVGATTLTEAALILKSVEIEVYKAIIDWHWPPPGSPGVLLEMCNALHIDHVILTGDIRLPKDIGIPEDEIVIVKPGEEELRKWVLGEHSAERRIRDRRKEDRS